MKTEQIVDGSNLLAIIIRQGVVPPGVHFMTDENNHLQVGKQLRKKGVVIKPHAHRIVPLQGEAFMQEVLCIESGRMCVDFYTTKGALVTQRELAQGDTILLIQGGHGFTMLDDCQFTEIKMGPYLADSKFNIEPVV